MKGESQGRSLVDAMHDGSDEGMQHFDGELQKLIRSGVIDIETGLTSSTNPGNLRVELADLLENDGNVEDAPPPSNDVPAEAELEIER